MKAEVKDGCVFFTFCGCGMKLTCTGENVFRLQSAVNGEFDFFGAAQTLAKDLGEQTDSTSLPLKLTSEGGKFTAEAENGCSVIITEKGIEFRSSSGKLIRKIKSIKTDGVNSSVTLSLSKNEKIYGTGERFDSVNRRGRRVHIYAIDKWCRTRGNSYVPIPFMVSSEGSGIFMNRYEHSVINTGFLCGDIKIKQMHAPVDLYIFTCGSIPDVLKAYSSLTGFAPVPPEWAFGTLVCRYHPEFGSPDGVYAMMDKMQENDFPWDAVIMEGWRTYEKERRNDLKEVSARVHGAGKKVMVYEQCGRYPKNAEALFSLTDSLAVQSDNGTYLKETRSMNLLDNFSKKAMRCIDLTNADAVSQWEKMWDELVSGIDIDGAKIDFCEQFPDKDGIRFSDGRSPFAAHHWYPVYYNILRYKHFSSKRDGGLNFSRGGGIGAQRYPFIWAGDQRREFYFLKAVIKAALSLGLSGVPFVSWDMAGYQPSFSLYDRMHEERVFMRALEFTAFSPCIQTHGRVKRPYDFDDHVKSVYRAYAYIHECLKPYIAEQAEVSTKTGLPLMRHLSIYDSSDEKCLCTEDEYMLGCALLVSPVLTRRRVRSIYLPEGRWINIFDGRKYQGPATLENCRFPDEMTAVFELESSGSSEIENALSKAQKYIDEINNLAK